MNRNKRRFTPFVSALLGTILCLACGQAGKEIAKSRQDGFKTIAIGQEIRDAGVGLTILKVEPSESSSGGLQVGPLTVEQDGQKRTVELRHFRITWVLQNDTDQIIKRAAAISDVAGLISFSTIALRAEQAIQPGKSHSYESVLDAEAGQPVLFYVQIEFADGHTKGIGVFKLAP